MHFYNDRVCVSFCGENMEIYILCSLFATFGAQRGAFEYLGPVAHLIKYIKLS